jgi:hypothetical protein
VILEEACRERSPWFIRLKSQPVFDFLHRDERYLALLRKIGTLRNGSRRSRSSGGAVQKGALAIDFASRSEPAGDLPSPGNC